MSGVTYPFSPEECAALICDLLIFEAIVSGESLVASIEQAGLRGERLLAPGNIQVGDAMGVLRARWSERTLTWHAHSLALMLYELVEPETLARGTKQALLAHQPACRTSHGVRRRGANVATGADR